MSCNHERRTEEWVTEVDDWYGHETSYWKYKTESTCVDIDLHRYKCTQCGEVMYYSGRARDYYEKGIRSEGIQGLE